MTSEFDWVKLISSEGAEFFLEKRVATAGSATMRAMLDGNFRESEDSVIRFPEISGRVLEKVIQYLYYKEQNSHSKNRIAEFPIEPEIALELLVAANYLAC